MTLRSITAVALAAATASSLATVPADAAPTGTSTSLSSIMARLTSSRALIARTRYGVPHIIATTSTGTGFGLGYAFAQDDICTFADDIVTLRAERSRYFGPDSTYADVTHGDQSIPNAASDFYYQRINDSGVIEAQLAKSSPQGPSQEARRLVTGYAAGYNAYLSSTGVTKIPDDRCRGRSWVTPITPLDVWRRIYQITDSQGAAAYVRYIGTAAPPSASPAARASASRASSALPPLGAAQANVGSNAIALGSSATPARSGAVLANPHFPWQGVDRFYEAQIYQPGGLDVSGATLFGVPAIFIGHNRTLAWTHTVSPAAHASVYYLHLGGGDDTSYVVDGQTHAMTTQQVTIQARNADGTLSPLTHTFYSTRDGVVALWPPASGAAFTVKDPNDGNLRWLDTELAMAHSASVTGLRTAIATWQGLPFVNTIASDTTGAAFYGDLSEVAHLSSDQITQCSVDVGPPVGVAVNGTTAACDWGSDPGTIQPHVFSQSNSPTTTRSDYVENSNDSYWLPNADPSSWLTGYSAAFGPTGTPRSPRTRQALTELQHALSSPGLVIGQEQVEKIILDNRNYSAEQDRANIVALCHAQPSVIIDGQPVDLTHACGVLAAWDGLANTTSVGEVLWREFLVKLELNPNGTLDPPPYVNPFDPTHPVTTPNTIDTTDARVITALGRAVLQLQESGISLDAPWGSVNGTRSATGTEIPVPGCTNGEGCLNVTYNVYSAQPAGGRLADVNLGSSYIMSIFFTPSGPQTNELLAYSESDNPSSPHFDDQTKLFSTGTLTHQPYTLEEIGRDPSLKTLLLRT